MRKKLIEKLKKETSRIHSPIHGLEHWQHVERNGLYLARFSGADPLVVSCFAYCHDCMRENDGFDPEHGPRGAKYAKSLGANFLELSKKQLETLCLACETHTSGSSTEDITVGTCWDADRLDLGRIGIVPDKKFLQTKEAKRIAVKSDFMCLRDD